MRVLGAIVQIAVLPVFDTRQDLSFRCTIAFQLIGDDDPWDVVAAFEELAEELLCRLLVASAWPCQLIASQQDHQARRGMTASGFEGYAAVGRVVSSCQVSNLCRIS